jgi:GNAT superfamily N-acetyltransferase
MQDAAPIRIRDAQFEDWPCIADFNRRLAFETESRELERSKVEAGVRAVLTNPQRGRYFVAECHGSPVGQLMCTHEWSDWRNGDFWWIQSVYVAESHRRMGVFRTLWEHVRAAAASDPEVVGLRLYAEQQNETALQSYERLGLVRTGYLVLEHMLPTPPLEE